MIERPKLPIVKVGETKYPRYEPNIALDIIERIADGELLSEITARDNPNITVTKRTFLYWVSTVPELAKAMRAAEQLSGRAFEEEAIAVARVTALSPGSPQKVSAAGLLIRQLNWSSARRDPTKYSEKAAIQVSIPVTINSSLDLGSGDGSKGEVEVPDMYSIRVPVTEAEFTEVEPEPVITKKEELKEMIDLSPVVSTERQPVLEAYKEERKRTRVYPSGPRKRVLTPRTKPNASD